MRRAFALAMLVALTVGLLIPGLAQAQTTTPETTQATGSFGVPLGTAVPIVGVDGAAVGTISLDQIIDPFEEFVGFEGAPRGYHFILAVMTVTYDNNSNRPLDLPSFTFTATDDQGFVVEEAYVDRGYEPEIPDIYSVDFSTGSSATFAIPYQVANGATLSRLTLGDPYYEQATAIVYENRMAPVDIGTPVEVLGSDGASVATLTVNSVTDPYQSTDASESAEAGSRFVAVDISIANTGTRTLVTAPSDFLAFDALGYQIESAYLYSSSSTLLDYGDEVAPGVTVTGSVVFQVPNNSSISQVVFGDSYYQQVVIADLSAGMGAVQPPSQPPATSTEVAGVPTAAATTAAVASNPDCAGLVDWGLDLLDRITRAGEVTAPFQDGDVSDVTAAQLTDIAAQLRVMGDEQAASNPPAAAAELNSIMVDQFYYPLADVVDDIATAVAEGNMAGAMTAMQNAQSLSSVFIVGGAYDTASETLTAACPAEIDQLNAAA